jgi:hypothetical protein
MNKEERRIYYKQWKESHPEYYKEWRQNHPEENKAYMKKYNQYPKRIAQKKECSQRYYKKNGGIARQIVLNYYSQSKMECACCGEKHLEFLTIDHINGGGVKHQKEIGVGRLYGWLIRNNFPEGFQVLCYNCNCAKGHYNYCPHQVEREEADKKWYSEQVQTLEEVIA